jgi:hypothetical protein
MPLPTFFVIGAAKSGTTSLNRYLALHPEIAMAEPQESHQLLGHGYEARLGGYLELFPGSERIRGETSSGYSNFPYNAEIVDRIAATVPAARFVYVVREPVERAVAHYAQHVIRGDERRPVDEALKPSERNYYVAASRYATQLERYLARFALERVLVIEQEELREQRDATLARAFAHVGADPEYRDPGFATEHNVRAGRGAQNVRLGVVGRRLQGSRLNELSRRALPARVRQRAIAGARAALGTKVLPEASPQTLARLREALRPEAERLRELLGRDFEGWSI